VTVPFRVGITAELRTRPGGPAGWGDIGTSALDEAGVDWTWIDQESGPLAADAIAGLDAVVFTGPSVTAQTVAGRPPLLLARFGVGIDSVDVGACTGAGVMVTNTPDGARRPVATAALTMVLALLQRLRAKETLARSGDWSDQLGLLGRGLTGLDVGTLGYGNVARELFGLLGPFETRNWAADPWVDPDDARSAGVRLVDLDTLCAEVDVLVVTAALTPSSRHAIDARRLALLRPGALVVNVSRGAIVDTDALVGALGSGHLGGAGLDVFETEPLPPGSPLAGFDNVLRTPHSLAWTSEMAWGNGSSAIRAVLAVRDGRVPGFVVNPDVLDHPRLRSALPYRFDDTAPVEEGAKVRA
jgi:phosphoglycerate dehydrogenase-like enzyme